MNKEEIINEIKNILGKVNNKKIIAVYLFGSVADENQTPLSDIDVCFICDKISFDEELRIMSEFNDNYDISFFNKMPIWIKMRVFKGIPVAVNDKNKLYDLIFAALDEYEDFRPLIQKRIFERFGKCMI